jgi:SAM-dependent methyltransferase
VRWAVELIDPAPDARVLEIGCGPGAAAELVCSRLTTGQLIACDRSATAVRRTDERNAEHVRAGRLSVRQAECAALELPPGSLDVAFAMNVNLFWVRDPARELAVLAAALRPGGALHLLWDGTPTTPEKVVEPVLRALDAGGYVDAGVVEAVVEGVGAFAISAARP